MYFLQGKGHVARVFLDDGRVDINKLSGGKSALHWSAEKGHIDVVRELVSRSDIEVNKTTYENSTQETALMLASCRGHANVVRELLAHPGIDFSKKHNYVIETTII